MKTQTRHQQKFTVITLLLVALIILSVSPQPITAQTEPLQTGLNYLSNGNAWTEPEGLLKWDFSRFQKDKIQYLSIRIMWNVMMPTPETLSPVALENIKKVLNTAEVYGLKVNLSFWTQFGFTLGFPWWAGTDYYSLLTEPTKTFYLNYLAKTVNELKTFPAVDSWSILNEPHYSDPIQKNQFQTLMADCVQTIKTVDDSRPISCRFALSDTPATGKYDNSIYNLFDAFAITVYLNASNPKDRVYNSRWVDYEKTVADCKALGLPLWVIEFGSRKRDTQSVAAMFESNIAKFQSDGVNRVYAWAWQTGNAAAEAFNLYGGGGNPKPAYYALLQKEASTNSNSDLQNNYAPLPQNTPVNVKKNTITKANSSSSAETNQKETDVNGSSATQPSNTLLQTQPVIHPTTVALALNNQEAGIVCIVVVVLCIVIQFRSKKRSSVRKRKGLSKRGIK